MHCILRMVRSVTVLKPYVWSDGDPTLTIQMSSITFMVNHFNSIFDTEELTLILLLSVGTVSKWAVPTFRRNTLPPFLALNEWKEQVHFESQDGSRAFPRNVESTPAPAW